MQKKRLVTVLVFNTESTV